MSDRLRWCLLASFALICGCSESDDNEKSHETDCVFGQTRCEAGMLQSCSGQGTWGDTPCTSPLVCSDASGKAACVQSTLPDGSCVNGATRCNNTALELCSNNQWTPVPCTGTCVEANGQATCQTSTACTAGLSRCNSGVMETCDGAKWNKVECSGTCVENGGTAFCQTSEGCPAGNSRCSNGSVETCNGSQWVSSPCNGKCIESGNAAVCQTGECSKGETRCDDDGTRAILWTCNDDLTWDKSECPATEIAGARLSCRNSSSCGTVLCGEGLVYQSENKRCAELTHSNACTIGRTYCNGKTNFLYECLETGNEAPTSATDCTKDGKVCVKFSDDEARCVAEECSGNFCDGETLVFCTDDHKIETGENARIDCTETDRICDLNENGIGECMYPECTQENAIRCIADDDTHLQYEQCINSRWSEIKTCEGGAQCETIQGVGYCAECHEGEMKCEEVEGKATKYSCSEQYTWTQTACPEATPVCDENHAACTETPDECGNSNHVGAGEDCDGTNMGKADGASGDKACQIATGDSKATGTLSCFGPSEAKACHFDTSNCKFCGNGTIESDIGEACEEGVEITKTCADVIENSTGKLKCSASCGFDTSECTTRYRKVSAIYKDYDLFVKVNSSSCSAQPKAPVADVDIEGIVTAIHPDGTGFYIQNCGSDDARGIFVYVKNSIALPKDMKVGSAYRIEGGQVKQYQCGVQISAESNLTIKPSAIDCSIEPKTVKISDILQGPKGNVFGSLVSLKGEKAIAERATATDTDSVTLNTPGGEKGWRIGTAGIGKEITVSSYLMSVASGLLSAGTKYNVTGIVVQTKSHMAIAPRTKDDITVNTCTAKCDNASIYACDGDELSENTITCAAHLGFNGQNGKAECTEEKDDCHIVCDSGYVLTDGVCKRGYLETFDFEGETTLSNTEKNAGYSNGSFKSTSSGLTWNYTNAHNALCGISPIDGNGLMLKDGGELQTTVSGGVSTITLQANKGTSGDGTRNVVVSVTSTSNSTNTKKCGTLSIIGDKVYNLPECAINISGEVTISVKVSGSQTNIDNIHWLSVE